MINVIIVQENIRTVLRESLIQKQDLRCVDDTHRNIVISTEVTVGLRNQCSSWAWHPDRQLWVTVEAFGRFPRCCFIQFEDETKSSGSLAHLKGIQVPQTRLSYPHLSAYDSAGAKSIAPYEMIKFRNLPGTPQASLKKTWNSRAQFVPRSHNPATTMHQNSITVEAHKFGI
jgi:hypothetical protein